MPPPALGIHGAGNPGRLLIYKNDFCTPPGSTLVEISTWIMFCIIRSIWCRKSIMLIFTFWLFLVEENVGYQRFLRIEKILFLAKIIAISNRENTYNSLTSQHRNFHIFLRKKNLIRCTLISWKIEVLMNEFDICGAYTARSSVCVAPTLSFV